MQAYSFHSSEHRFITIIESLFGVARLEYQYRVNSDLLVAKEKSCSAFEWRCLQLSHSLQGLLVVLESLNITLSLISKFPDDEYMQQYGYTAKGYALYHYSVICHKLSTINDLFFKLVRDICFYRMDDIYSWDDIKQPLKQPEYKEFVKVQVKFYKLIKLYLIDRNKSSHEGLVFNSQFDNYWLTDFVTNHVTNYPESRLNSKRKYIRGTQENVEEIEETTQQYVDKLMDIMKKADKYTYEMFDALETLLLNGIDDILTEAQLKCWNRISVNSFPKIEDYLEHIVQTQLQIYWQEPDELKRFDQK